MSDLSQARVSKITVARLYNLGSYEHARYELTIEVPEGASAAKTLRGIERLLSALSPKPPGDVKSDAEIDRERHRLLEMKKLLADNPADFERFHGGYKGTADEYLTRIESGLHESIAKREVWEARAAKARELLDDLGGAAEWKDAKLDWEDDF